MASFLSFATLIEAISRSVAQAQDEVEKHQVRNLLGYFDKDQRPLGIEFRVPSRRSEASAIDEDFYSVPLLSLVSINVLKIKDVEIKFSVDMGELQEVDPPASDATAALASLASKRQGKEQNKGETMAAFTSPMKALNVSTSTGRGGGKVRVTLRVEGSEPSEGAARLLDYLAQMQGVYQPFKETSSGSTEPELKR